MNDVTVIIMKIFRSKNVIQRQGINVRKCYISLIPTGKFKKPFILTSGILLEASKQGTLLIYMGVYNVLHPYSHTL